LHPRGQGSDLLFEAASRFAHAADLAYESRQAWYAAEMPLTVQWENGIESAHPLLKVIRDAEADAAKYGVAIGIDAKVKGRPGRKPEAVIRPKVGVSPAARLRAVKR
jgi:hypothetical protein